MPVRPPPITYECSVCGWKKTVQPKSDVRLDEFDYFSQCQQCQHAPLNTHTPSTFRSVLTSLSEIYKILHNTLKHHVQYKPNDFLTIKEKNMIKNETTRSKSAEFDGAAFGKNMQQEFDIYKNKTKKPNILIIGGTGVGKSSLINTCFNANIARAGTGDPVTQQLQKYSHADVPVVLYDTKGYEVGNGKEIDFIQSIVDYTAGQSNTDNQIHLAWYCIQASGHRITDFDLRAIAKLKGAGIPVAIVLTKAELISDEESKMMQQTVANADNKLSFFETSSIDKTRKWQLDDLCIWSVERLPEALRRAFISAQKQSLKLKQEECMKIIKQHVASAIGVSFSPIPVSDAPLLLANEGAMITRIIYVYNLDSILKSHGSKFVAGLIAPIITRSAAMLAGNLVKWIPGIGTAVGGIINATVAASITYALGTTSMKMCEAMNAAELEDGEIGLDLFLKSASEFFTSQFETELKKSH